MADMNEHNLSHASNVVTERKQEALRGREMSLLDKARAVAVRSGTPLHISDEMVELALAWARGEITVKQGQTALAINDHATFHRRMALILQHMVMGGLLVPGGWLRDVSQ